MILTASNERRTDRGDEIFITVIVTLRYVSVKVSQKV